MDHTSHSGGDPKNSVYRSPGGTPSRYGDIRRMLDDGRVMDAELLLDSISATARAVAMSNFSRNSGIA